ncbi:MAG: hypothetical protein HWD81_06520 [Marivivens sp.]|nr:hypothetical protein [Marivivens sp.]
MQCNALKIFKVMMLAALWVANICVVTEARAETDWKIVAGLSLDHRIAQIADHYARYSTGTSSNSGFGFGDDVELDYSVALSVRAEREFDPLWAGLRLGVSGGLYMGKAELRFPDGISVFVTPVGVKSSAIGAELRGFVRGNLWRDHLIYDVGVGATKWHSTDEIIFNTTLRPKEERYPFEPFQYVRLTAPVLTRYNTGVQVYGEVIGSGGLILGSIGIEKQF